MNEPDAGAKIHLTATECRIVRYIAKQRWQANRDAGITDAQVGPQSPQKTDLIGYAAELAFAKMFNVYPDFSISPRRGSADCARFGEAIDVKGTTYPNGRMLAVVHKQFFAADVYALVIVDWLYAEDDAEAWCKFAGFANARDLLTPEHLMDLGHGPTYAMEQPELIGQIVLAFERRRGERRRRE